MVERINNSELGKESTKTWDRLDYQTEIGKTVQSLEDFLRSKWVPEDGIAAVWCLDEDKLELFSYLKQKWNNMDKIYKQVIKPYIIQEYRLTIQDGWLFSKYWNDQILESNKSGDIGTILYRLSKNPHWTWLTYEETKELLDRLREYYLKRFEFMEKNRDKFNKIDMSNIKQCLRKIERLYSNEKDIETGLRDSLSEFENGWDGFAHFVSGKIQLLQKNIKLSRDLFQRLLNYPVFYNELIGKVDCFDIEAQDYKNLFWKVLEHANKLDIINKERLLDRLHDYLDSFEWLEDSDYINLYLCLHPKKIDEGPKKRTSFFSRKNRKDWENGEITADEEMSYRINNISKIDSIKDFVDLIKNTSYWTEDLSKKIFDLLIERKNWYVILENYECFSSYISKQDLFDALYNDGNKYDLLGWLPFFDNVDENKLDDILGSTAYQDIFYFMWERYNRIKNQSKRNRNTKK